MDKLLKKIIIIFGVLFLSIVLINNCFYLSTITDSVDEKVNIIFYGAVPLIVTVCISALIFFVTNKLEKKSISDIFREVTGRTPVVKYVQDKNIIGGFLMKWDDKVFNSKINHKIESLKDRIISKEILWRELMK